MKDDIEPRGTFLLDWTIERDIALYFSTYEGRGADRRVRTAAGAIWVFLPMLTGKVLMTMKLRDVLSLMRSVEFRIKAEKTLPLIFHPPRQTVQEGSDEWYRFSDYAAADWGIVPRDIMEDEEVVKVLPVLFRTLRREKPSEEDLNRWVKMLRTA